jgi:peptidase M24
MPHGVASDKKIENGDVVTIDFGCIYNHYCSDMTRTFFVGKPDPRLENIYQIVYEAQIAAVEGYHSGMTGAELDHISREMIAAKGYGPNFGHSLGHGVGIEIHEGTAISPRNNREILENTVFSIEPGIYVENLGGVRIEDLVVLEKERVRILTADFDKKMLVL